MSTDKCVRCSAPLDKGFVALELMRFICKPNDPGDNMGVLKSYKWCLECGKKNFMFEDAGIRLHEVYRAEVIEARFRNEHP